MLTPYDWQEGISHRAQYVESRLSAGSPVILVSLDAGILAFSMRRQARKLFEIYDRLMFAGMGQQSDVEALRVAAIEFAHQEGYARSEADVTIQRVVAALSPPLKRAFADFNSAPFVVRAVFAEVGPTPNEDLYYVLDYDGDFLSRRKFAYLAPDEGAAERLKAGVRAASWAGLTPEQAVSALEPIWARTLDETGTRSFAELSENLEREIALLERNPTGQVHFRLLSDS